MIYTLTLNPSLDVDLTLPKLVPDDSNRVSLHRNYPGGKGLNVSRVVKEMGGHTMAFVFLGGHTGDEVGRLLRVNEVPFESLEITEETRTNVFITDQSAGTMTRINERGETLSNRAIRLLFEKLDLLDLRRISHMVLGGSLPGNTPKDLYIKIIKRLNAKGDSCRILLDADGDTLMRSLEARPHIIKPNTHEASRALGWEVKTREDAIKAGKEFLAMGIEIVLLSMGEKGALAISKEGVWHATPPRIDAISAVGAGDAFIGGFLSSLTLGLDEGVALRRGCAAGAAATLTPGTELCHAADIARLVEDVRLEKVE